LIEKIYDLKSIQLVLELLRKKVGSPISYSSIAEDVQIAPNTVKKYIQIFESLYIVFKVVPYSKNIARAILKEPKIYFYDTGMVLGDYGLKLENFVAVSLIKYLHSLEDLKGKKTSLNYIKTKEKKEVDFCFSIDGKLDIIIEVKLSDKKVSSNLKYVQRKTETKAVQLVKNLKIEEKIGKIEIRKIFDYLKALKVK
jgi:uncharacterized protein